MEEGTDQHGSTSVTVRIIHNTQLQYITIAVIVIVAGKA